MSVVASLKEKLMSLQHNGFWWLLAATASAMLSVGRRSPNFIYRDAEGDWVHRQSGATLYSRAYSSISIEELSSRVLDVWCYEYNIKAGDIVVDIGAGVGDDALIFSRLVGPTGRVIAIEASPQTFRCLAKTIKANGLHNVTALCLAISDGAGEVFMEDDDRSHLANRVGVESGTRVTATTLDNLLRDIELTEPTVVKMNIEGAETAALRGAGRTLKSRAHWIISCHDFITAPGYEKSATHADVTALLKNAGLEVLPARVDERVWIPFDVYARPSWLCRCAGGSL